MSGMEQLQQLMKQAIDSGQYTSRSLGAVAGCSHQQICNILNGKSQPTIGLAENIFRALGAEIVVKKRPARKFSA